MSNVRRRKTCLHHPAVIRVQALARDSASSTR